MSKQRIIDYVMNTPGNTNPNVLDTILDEEMNNRFIVKLTPTSETGGTMDKSNVEILEAYTQGKQIMFDITVGSAACRVQATIAASFDGVQYPSFNAYGIDTSGTTIINLYVDPSDEESYSFTMDAVEISGGGGGGVLVVTNTAGTLDKTWQEIHDAMLSGGAVVQIGQTSVDAVACVYVINGTYNVRSYSQGSMILYSTSSASGYPVNDK